MQLEQLTSRRGLLLGRLAQLHPAIKRTRGYRTALNLLGQKFSGANSATQVALLQAATFMVDILEKLPVQ